MRFYSERWLNFASERISWLLSFPVSAWGEAHLSTASLQRQISARSERPRRVFVFPYAIFETLLTGFLTNHWKIWIKMIEPLFSSVLKKCSDYPTESARLQLETKRLLIALGPEEVRGLFIFFFFLQICRRIFSDSCVEFKHPSNLKTCFCVRFCRLRTECQRNFVLAVLNSSLSNKWIACSLRKKYFNLTFNMFKCFKKNYLDQGFDISPHVWFITRSTACIC